LESALDDDRSAQPSRGSGRILVRWWLAIKLAKPVLIMGSDDDFGRHVHDVGEEGDGVEGDSEILVDGRWNLDAATLFTSSAVVQW